jgi:hypothetical protein
MNRWRGWRVLAGVVCALGVLPAQDGGAVEGHAVNSITRAPIGGVEVRLWTKDATHYVTNTDAAGAFRIDGIKAGQYNFQFEKTGYVPTVVVDPQKVLRVGLAKEAIRLDVELTPSATLAGRVLDGDGKPVAKVEVLAPGKMAAMSFGFKAATTDEEGRFTFDSLDPGSYTLLAKPPDKTSETPAPEGERVEVLPTYFPSALDRAQAEVLNVKAGADLSGYDIRLRSAPVYRVRGVVLDEAGMPAEKAEVALTSRGEHGGSLAKFSLGSAVQYVMQSFGGSPEAQAVSGKDGAFEFPAVRAGEWSVGAELEGEWDPVLRHPTLLRGSENLLVGRQDIDHVEIRLAAPFNLPVEADWGDAPPGSNRRFAVLGLYGMDAQLPVMFVGGPRIQIMPGRYRIAGGPPINGYSPASVMLAGQDVLGQVVDLRPELPPLKVIYKRSTTSLRGTVEKGEGGTVLVWAQVAEGPTVMDAVTCGPNGNFEAFVQPGAYHLLAVDRVDTRTVPDAAFLQQMIASATSVSVEEGATAVVQLPLTPWPQ